MIQVIVLAGGDSDERAVSLRSGAAVATALRTGGYAVTELDPAQPGPDYEAQLAGADLVFPVLHGKGGEDGVIQSWLDSRGIRYVGATVTASELCFDKWRYKQLLQSAGLPTPAGELVQAGSIWESPLVRAPFVLKPHDGGSSIDTYIVRDPVHVDRQAIDDSFTRHQDMLLEELIEGTEATIGVLLGAVLPVIEIVPPAGGEFDYDNKYNGRTQEICPPRSISTEIQLKLQDLTTQIHKLTGVYDMSRTDIMIGKNGTLYVLETNTIPGLTTQSLFPKAAATAGYSMPDMVRLLVDAALARR